MLYCYKYIDYKNDTIKYENMKYTLLKKFSFYMLYLPIIYFTCWILLEEYCDRKTKKKVISTDYKIVEGYNELYIVYR
jgi:hypothetical protein